MCGKYRFFSVSRTVCVLILPLQDVSLAAMFVSAKMHDTLKKPRELLAVSYAIRFPDLASKSKHLGGDVDLDTMDPSVRFLSECVFR